MNHSQLHLQKEGFLLIVAIFRASLPSEDKVIDWEQPLFGEPHNSFTFELSTCFIMII